MTRINILLTFLSLNAILVILERLSPTTTIILQPYNFLRVHEVFQMLIVITLSIIISFYLLKHLSHNFELLKTKNGTVLGIIFILGIYFTATGNGLHEMASFLFNTFCNTKIIESKPCGAMFFNDYYFGNIIYFIGLLLGNISLILFEKSRPEKNNDRKQAIITIINGFVYALALVAYAAFDLVLVGLFFVVISAGIVLYLFFQTKNPRLSYPFTLYCTTAYTSAMIITLLIRFH